MPQHADTLKSMLQDIINGREESAAATMHDYFVAKTREVTGLAQPQADDSEVQDLDLDNADAE